MTAKDLKNALLQEAVQGKLVPQIASEGNAKDLLEEIRKEKAKLIKEGKLKKEKPLPEITDDEIPFDIPENWCWCRITDISTCELGKTKDVQKNKGELKDYLCSINIQEDGIDLTNVKQMKFEKDEFDRYTVKKDDLLICEGGDAGRCAIYNRETPMHYQNALHRVRFFKDINPFFYLYLFQLYKANNLLSEASKGVTIQHLTGAALKELCFPLPPISEQKRIVSAIEQFMPLIEEYGKKEAELTALNADIAKTLKNAILQEAVQGKLAPQIASEGNAKDLLEEIKKEKAKLIKEGKPKKEKPLPEITDDEIPFDIPENWCWCRLGEIVDTNIGLTYSPSDIVQKGGTGVLRSNNIQGGKIVLDDLVHVKKNVTEKCLAKKGDLLICARNGSRALVGKCALIEKDGMAFGAFMAIVRSKFNPYIMYFINSPVYRAKLEGVRTTTINQITQDNLRETLIPFPPLNEQKRIVKTIEKMMPLIDKLGENID